jgi:hypothetical protein
MASLALIAFLALALSACGGDRPRQDEEEPEGEFPVQITKAEFPARQKLAGTQELVLAVRNAGDETIPSLAVYISTDDLADESEDDEADEAFSTKANQEDLALPSRPVWVLEYGYPRLAGETAPAGAAAAQTKTYNFGPLEPGQTREMVWRVTPTIAGTFAVEYRIAAGLQGKAKAVTPDGNVPEGEFVVKITDIPEQTRVDDAGRVVPIDPQDIVGQAGSAEQQGEVGAGGKPSK